MISLILLHLFFLCDRFSILCGRILAHLNIGYFVCDRIFECSQNAEKGMHSKMYVKFK